MPAETAAQFNIHDARTNWFRGKLVAPDDWDSDLPA
jgi:hypothetical protein